MEYLFYPVLILFVSKLTWNVVAPLTLLKQYLKRGSYSRIGNQSMSMMPIVEIFLLALLLAIYIASPTLEMDVPHTGIVLLGLFSVFISYFIAHLRGKAVKRYFSISANRS